MSRFAPRDLVIRARTDAAAIEPLIVAIWPHCFRVAAAVLGDRRLAEDAAQEACIVVQRALRRLRSVEAFDGWTYRIVLREAARIARGSRMVSPADPATLALDDPTSLDVWRALAALPPHLRSVVVLFYFDDLPGDSIARILRVSPVTVRTRLARARKRLRGLLDERDLRSSSTPWETVTNAV